MVKMGLGTKLSGNLVRQTGKQRGTGNKLCCDDPLRSTGICSPELQAKTSSDANSATGNSGSQIGKDSYSKKRRPIAMQDRNRHYSINRNLGTAAIRRGIAIRQMGPTFSPDSPPSISRERLGITPSLLERVTGQTVGNVLTRIGAAADGHDDVQSTVQLRPSMRSS